MRPGKHLFGLILLTASICVSASAQANRAQVRPEAFQQVNGLDARILFTGRLLGYFRLPDRQMATGDDASKCPKTLNEAGPDVRDFLSQAAKNPDTILVGTGDNFAPELFSRIFKAPPYPDRRNKDGYTWDWLTKKAWVRNEDVDGDLARRIRLGQGRIPMDNVACFLARAGYDAIVPGKHDFHFGPERLRHLARLLASFNEIDDPGYHPVQMLAANVVIQTKYFNGEKAVPDTHRGVQYLTPSDKAKLNEAGWGETQPANFSDKDSVLPWLRHITVKSNLSNFGDIKAELVRGNKNDPYNLENKIAVSLKSKKNEGGDYDFALPDGALTPGENYFFCLDNQTSLPYCTRFAVYSPFFTYKSKDWEKGEEHPKDPEPYFYKKLRNGTEVAVFGVVDQELREHVGQLNFAWNNPEKPYQTEILVIDPVTALKQLLQRFKECNPDFKGVKILLAQTSAPRAKQLAVQLTGEFHVVISQGQLEYATPDQTLKIDLTDMAPDSDSRHDGLRPGTPSFLAVPPPYFNPESKKRTLRVRELRVINNSNQKDIWRFAVRGLSQKPTVHQPATGCDDFDTKVLNAVALLLKGSTGNYKKQNPGGNFQLLTLHTMRKKIGADVALIQKRDFFWPPPTDGCNSTNLQDYIDWVLWKGDFLMRRQIPGKTLKAIIARSNQYEEDDRSNVSLAIEKNRALITLGVTYDNRLDEYFINGLPLDPGQLYTVATTDYIGLGDTGFAELAQPAVGDPRRPRDFERLDYISSLVCVEMKHLDKSITSQCEAPVKADPYFDKLSQDPTDGSPRLGSLGRLKAWARPGKDSSRIHQALPTQKDLFERKQQDRPILSTSLEKASIGFSGIRHRFSEQERATLFAGIPITQLGARRSHSWDFDQSLKVLLTGKWIDRFASEELRYSTDVTRQETGPTIINQKTNMFALEGGTYLHWTKELPRFVFLTASRYETQFAPPITTFNLGTGDRLIAEDLGRSHAVLFKAGPRWENRKSSIEFGYVAGHQFNAITGFLFDDVSCIPSARRSFQSCIKDNSKPGAPLITPNSMVRAERESRFRHGFFLNFKLVVPLPSRLSYRLENQGEFFITRPVDNSTDTRYQDVIKQVLSIPLFANLHLEPKLEVFLYKNKVELTRFWQRQYGLTINYKFDWFKGNRLRDALWYKKPGN